MRDLPKFIEGLHDYIGKAIAPLLKLLEAIEPRLKALEDRPPAKDGIDGKDADEAAIVARLESAADAKIEERAAQAEANAAQHATGLVDSLKAGVEQRIGAIEPLVTAKIGAEEARAIAAEEAGKIIPEKGADGPTVDDLTPVIEAALRKRWDEFNASGQIEGLKQIVDDAIKAIPPPKNGVDGKSITLDDVRPMIDSVIELVVAKWALEVERRNTDRMQAWEKAANESLQRAVDALPKPRDGLDGMGFDDVRMEHDGERGFAFVLEKGDRVKRFEFSVPAVLDRGYHERGKAYRIGDGVTYQGSYWIAKEDTDLAPGENDAHWRRSVMKGRDARMVKLDENRPKQPVRLSEAG